MTNATPFDPTRWYVVVFMVNGKDIRHVGHLSAPPPKP